MPKFSKYQIYKGSFICVVLILLRRVLSKILDSLSSPKSGRPLWTAPKQNFSYNLDKKRKFWVLIFLLIRSVKFYSNLLCNSQIKSEEKWLLFHLSIVGLRPEVLKPIDCKFELEMEGKIQLYFETKEFNFLVKLGGWKSIIFRWWTFICLTQTFKKFRLFLEFNESQIYICSFN